ncbi:MAG: hypothetical protein ABJD07_09180 [Gemmatimonadaceae bacterium]
MTALFSTASLSGVSGALVKLMTAQMQLGSDLLESVTGVSVPSLTSELQQRTKKMTATCCTIPAPCWMPQPLGDCVSHTSQCKTACIELVITNCDRTPHPVTVSVAGDAAGDVTVTPATITLGAFMRGKIKLCFAVPTDAKNGEEHEMVVHVQGCRDYYLRWTVSVGTVGIDSCHTITIEDCPDLVHHWYDHFYCQRGCHARTGTVGGVTGTVVGVHG